MKCNNCNCDEFPVATFIEDEEEGIVFVNELFCPSCFLRIVTDGNYSRNEYMYDKRKYKEISDE